MDHPFRPGGDLAALYPLIRIFRRAGLPAWPVAFLVVPIVGFAIVGSYLAFQRWPNIAPARRAQARAQTPDRAGE